MIRSGDVLLPTQLECNQAARRKREDIVTGPVRGILTGALGALLLSATPLGASTTVSAGTTEALGHGVNQSWGYGYPYYGPTSAGWTGYGPYGGNQYQYPGFSGSTSPSVSPSVPASSTADSAATAATLAVICQAFYFSAITNDCESRVYRTFYVR